MMLDFFHVDTRGKQSRTLAFVSVSWFALTVKFVSAGITFDGITTAPMTATEYGLAVAAVLAIWLGREITDKGVSR
jgi:hypothetical protein